jgi:[ribosomal protein S18]-alanine N-acetyltransferase
MADADLDWVVNAEATLHFMPWTRQNFVDAFAAGYSAWVWVNEGTPAGYAVMFVVLDEAHLLDFSVLPSFQGQGLGRTMMQHLWQVCREQGALQMFLEVRPSNKAALALYRRMGFAEIGRRKQYYPAPEGREDALVMKAPL